MWWTRKRHRETNEDAELRDLVNEYAQLYNEKSSITSIASSTQNQTSFQTPNAAAIRESLSNFPKDQVIEGQSLRYTREEAEKYANEEPCDSWRHIDVSTFFNFSLRR